MLTKSLQETAQKKCEPGKLEVRIIGATELKSGSLGAPNPYVIVTFAGNKCQTEILRNTNNPLWKARFFFNTEDVPVDSNITIAVMSHGLLSEKELGFIEFQLSMIVNQDGPVEKTERLKDNEGQILTKNQSSLDVGLSWTSLSKAQDKEPKRKEYSISNRNYEGLLKVSILSGTGLSPLEKFKQVWITFGTSAKKFQTTYKTNKNTQFNESFILEINEGNKNIEFELMNQDSKTKFLAGKTVYDLAGSALFLFKPKTTEIILRDIKNPDYKAFLLIELVYMYSDFIRNPVGTLSIDATNIHIDDPKKQSYKYQFNGKMQPIPKAGAKREFGLKERNDKIKMILCEKTNLIVRTVASGDINPAEYPWKIGREGKLEYSLKMELLGKNTAIKVTLTLTYSPQNPAYKGGGTLVMDRFSSSKENRNTITGTLLKQEPTQMEKGGVTGEEEKKVEISQMQDEYSSGQPKTSADRLEKEPTMEEEEEEAEELGNKEKQTTGIVTLSGFNLKAYYLRLTLLKSPSYYLVFESNQDRKKFVSDISTNTSPNFNDYEFSFSYQKGTPLVLRVYLRDLHISTQDSSTKDLNSLLIGEITLEPPNNGNQSQELKIPMKLDEGFQAFLKKNHMKNDDPTFTDPLKSVQNAAIVATAKYGFSEIAENSIGVLTLTEIRAKDLVLSEKQDSLTPQLRLTVGQDIFLVEDEVDPVFPKWELNCPFSTKRSDQVLQVSIFLRNPERNVRVIDINIPLYELTCTRSKHAEQHLVKLDSQNDVCRGQLILTYSYQPVATHSFNSISLKAFNPLISNNLSAMLTKANNFVLNVALRQVVLNFKLQDEADFACQVEMSLSSNRWIGPIYANTRYIANQPIFHKFLAEVRKKSDQYFQIKVKVFLRRNPKKVLRLYTATLDWSNFLKELGERIQFRLNLTSNSIYSKDVENGNTVLFDMQILRSSDYDRPAGIINFECQSIEIAGENLGNDSHWKQSCRYVLEFSNSFQKSYLEGSIGSAKAPNGDLVILDSNFNTLDTGVYYKCEKFFIDNLKEGCVIFDKKKSPSFAVSSLEDIINVRLYECPKKSGADNKLDIANSRPLAQGTLEIAQILAFLTNPESKTIRPLAINLLKEGRDDFKSPQDQYFCESFMNLFLVLTPKFLSFNSFGITFGNEEGKQKPQEQEAKALSNLNQALLEVRPVSFIRVVSNDDEIGALFDYSQELGSSKKAVVGYPDLKQKEISKMNDLKSMSISLSRLVSIFMKPSKLTWEAGIDKIPASLYLLSISDQSKRVGGIKFDSLLLACEALQGAIDLQSIEMRSCDSVTQTVEIWEKNMLKGQAVYRLSLNDNYFAKAPVGKLSFNKITIEVVQEFPLEEISSVELLIETEKQELYSSEKDSNSSLIKIDEFKKAQKSKIQIEKGITLSTFQATDRLSVNFKNASQKIIASGKIYLADVPFINPQIQKSSNGSQNLEIICPLVIFSNNPSIPNAFAVLQFYTYYKDSVGSAQASFNSLQLLFKFKNIMNLKIASMRQLVYYNNALQKITFGGKFLRIFNTECKAFKPDQLPVSLVKKTIKSVSDIKKMSPVDAKKQLIVSSSNRGALNLSIPSGTEFLLDGEYSSRYPIEVILSYRASSETKPTDKKFESTAVQKSSVSGLNSTLKIQQANDTNRTVKQPARVEIKKIWKESSLLISHSSDGSNHNKTIKNIFQTDFYLFLGDFDPRSLELEIRFQARGDTKKSYRGLLDISPLTKNLNGEKAAFEDCKFFVFLTPGNQRITLTGSYNQSDFTQNPHGNVTLTIHRLVYLEQLDFNPSTSILYRNRNLLITKEMLLKNKYSQNYNFSYRIKAKNINQKEVSGLIHHYGMPIENAYEKMSFFTEGINDIIDLELLLTAEHPETSEETNGNSKEEQKKEDPSKVTVGTGLKSKDPEKSKSLTTTQVQDKIVISKGIISLGDYNLPRDKPFYLYIPFQQTQQKKDTVLSAFLSQINRENIYLLGSLEYQPIEWVYLHIKPKRLSNLWISSSTVTAENNASAYKLGLDVIFMVRDPNGRSEERSNQASQIYKVEYAEGQACEQYFLDEIFSYLHRPSSQREELLVAFKVLIYDGSQQETIATRVYPLNGLLRRPEDFEKEIELNIPLNSLPGNKYLKKGDDELNLNVIIYPSKLLDTSFAKRKARYNTKMHHIERFDFRRDDIMKILLYVVNSKVTLTTYEALNEIYEYIIFTNRPDELLVKEGPLFMEVFRRIYILYNQNWEMVLTALRNIFALMSLHELSNKNLDELFGDLQELALLCLREATRFTENSKNVQSTDPKNVTTLPNDLPKMEMTKSTSRIEKKFDNPLLIQFSKTYSILPDMKPEEFSINQLAKISEVMTNNRILRENSEELDEEEAEKKFEEPTIRSYAEIFLYISKVCDVFTYQNDANLILFKTKMMFLFDLGIKRFANIKPDLTIIFARIVRSLYALSQYGAEPPLSNDLVVEIMDSLLAIDPKVIRQTMQLENLYNLIELMVRQLVADESLQIKPDLWPRILSWMEKSYNTGDSQRPSYFAQLLLFLQNFKELKITKDAIQNSIDSLQLCTKITDNLTSIGNSEITPQAERVLYTQAQIIDILAAKFDVKEKLNVKTLIQALQYLISRKNISEKLKVKFQATASNINLMMDANQSINKARYLKQIQKPAKETKQLPIIQKYSITNIDWLKK